MTLISHSSQPSSLSLLPQTTSQARIPVTRNYLPLSSTKASDLTILPLPSLQELFITFSRIQLLSSGPATAFLGSPRYESYILGHFNRMINHTYFKPIREQKSRLFEMVTSRLRTSRITRWIMLLNARVCESSVEGAPLSQLFNRWVRDLEVAVRATLVREPTSLEAQSLQGDWLELLLVKAVVGPTTNAIQVLQSAAPAFLQTACSCPDLWSDNPDPMSIPLPKIVVSKHHELANFALIDCTCAMIFGVPQQVEYDTSTGSLSNGPLPYEWAHSTPTEFLVLLAEINACRDQQPGARDRREIEYQLVTWLSRPAHNETWESWMAVAWLAVQESWRLTLLAYLYLVSFP
ncbi:unnamed protein product [Rhizoctonia solani]|uniref:Uncharacterized protein n=1 Tax=Rhizoctonia solani TaxID=456999 RepID=A0A8H2Y0D5_9AGAM|nr:unnamed protein product [Rhizoctonia solani]